MQGLKFKVKYGGEESDDFNVQTGLKQEDTLSLIILRIALESIMKEILVRVTRIKIINDQQTEVAAYVYDVTIMVENEEDLKRTTSELIEDGEQI